LGRDRLLRELTSQICGMEATHPMRVAIDGPDAAGKTTLADELAPVIEVAGRPVIRASLDAFHNPRSIRYRRGELSPEGYYRDSFNDSALISHLLKPLGPGSIKRYRRAAFDLLADQPVTVPEEVAPADAVLLLDGIFLHRRSLLPYWEFSIYLRVSESEILARAARRDANLLGGLENVRDRYLQRYLPAQQLYRAECHPQAAASCVIDNEDPHAPFFVRLDESGGTDG
jgi:uridine kinase